MSSPAQTLGSWVPIPLEAWMSVCFYSVLVLFCVEVEALLWAYHRSKESYRLCMRLRNWKKRPGPKLVSRAFSSSSCSHFRSQWPRGLFSLFRTLGSWVRIPLKAWISMCVYSVCVVLYVGSGLTTGWTSVQGVLPNVYRIKKLIKRPRSNKRTVEP
jgi:hypothetical protein